MWKTGHSLIKDKMRELGAPVAGEMSGHMFFTEGFYGHDDALYGAARLLRILAAGQQTIKQALADVPDFVSTPEIRIDVDEEGTIIWGDRILILYARDVLSRTGKGQPIIFDVKCSQALSDAIEKAGGKAVMWKTGHSLIKDKMKETHAPVAGEMSGHMFFSEGFYGHDDALYGAARLLRILAAGKQTIKQAQADVPD
jgi:phosphomannomutase